MKQHIGFAAIFLMAYEAGVGAQTQVHLRTQGRAVDFSGAASTKPSKTGTTLPATCSPGETFFKTNAQAGQNWYGCTESNVWTQQGGPAAPVAAPPNYAQSFTGRATVAIPGSAHGFGTANLVVQCYDDAAPAAMVEPGSVVVDAATYDVTVSFAQPQSGSCVVSGSGGSGAVASVFGRTGAVAAQSGDYGFDQISGTVADGQLAAGINAAKIGSGAVSNTAFGYLAGATANVQAQLNGKAAASHSHVGGGDVSGDLTNATVTRIQTRAVSSTAPADGQALVWSAGANAWAPGTVSAGGGGAAAASQLRDLDVTRTTSTVLTVGGSCTTASPCNVRFGNTVYSFTRSCTATISGGTGTAYFYVTSGGVLTIGHNLTVAASAGCMAQGSVNSFPVDAVPLSTWTATNAAWDSGGGHDFRGWLSAKTIGAGTGVMTMESAGRTLVSVDAATVPTYLSSTAVLDFPMIAAGTCSADMTFSLPGAVVQDSVAPGWPAALEPGLAGTMRVSAANTVAVRVCNVSGAGVDPASGTFRATVVRSF